MSFSASYFASPGAELDDFLQTIERARQDPAVPHAAFRALHAIASAGGSTGVAHATLTAFAAMAGSSAGGFTGSIDRLSALGYISVARRGAGYPIPIKIIARPPKKQLSGPLPAEASA